jgi:acetyl-CoA acetyltransferase
MTEAVIVSIARTPIGKAYRGALNNTEGATVLGHALIEGRRRKVKYAAVTMCFGGGMGAAGLFEVVH